MSEPGVTKQLLQYMEMLKLNTNSNGEKLLNGKHVQAKLMSKVCNLLFSELVKMY